jgi:hypothetical protein
MFNRTNSFVSRNVILHHMMLYYTGHIISNNIKPNHITLIRNDNLHRIIYMTWFTSQLIIFKSYIISHAWYNRIHACHNTSYHLEYSSMKYNNTTAYKNNVSHVCQPRLVVQLRMQHTQSLTLPHITSHYLSPRYRQKRKYS